jgi:hypothetical protein
VFSVCGSNLKFQTIDRDFTIENIAFLDIEKSNFLHNIKQEGIPVFGQSQKFSTKARIYLSIFCHKINTIKAKIFEISQKNNIEINSLNISKWQSQLGETILPFTYQECISEQTKFLSEIDENKPEKMWRDFGWMDWWKWEKSNSYLDIKRILHNILKNRAMIMFYNEKYYLVEQVILKEGLPIGIVVVDYQNQYRYRQLGKSLFPIPVLEKRSSSEIDLHSGMNSYSISRLYVEGLRFNIIQFRVLAKQNKWIDLKKKQQIFKNINN